MRSFFGFADAPSDATKPKASSSSDLSSDKAKEKEEGSLVSVEKGSAPQDFFAAIESEQLDMFSMQSNAIVSTPPLCL